MDNKPQGRMSAYAFFLQTCYVDYKKEHPENSMVFNEFSMLCANRWKAMTEKEKERFNLMAEKDKARYNVEMTNYKLAKGETVLRKRTKDTRAPKRPLCAYFMFTKDEYPKVKESMPDTSVSEITTKLQHLWNTASIETKAKYEALAAEDQTRYEKDLKAYKDGLVADFGNNLPETTEKNEQECLLRTTDNTKVKQDGKAGFLIYFAISVGFSFALFGLYVLYWRYLEK